MTVSRLVRAGVDPLAALGGPGPRRGAAGAAGPPPPAWAAEPGRALRAATKDGYARPGSKAARNYPGKKREKPPGPPKIKSATRGGSQTREKTSTAGVPLRWTA